MVEEEKCRFDHVCFLISRPLSSFAGLEYRIHPFFHPSKIRKFEHFNKDSNHKKEICLFILRYRGVLKWWYPTTIGFPTKMTILGCFGGTTILGNTHIKSIKSCKGSKHWNFPELLSLGPLGVSLRNCWYKRDVSILRSRTFLGQEIHDKFLQAHIVSLDVSGARKRSGSFTDVLGQNMTKSFEDFEVPE